MDQMTDLFQRGRHDYAPMLGPLEEWPPGSPEWAERLSFRIKLNVENIEEQGVDRLIPWIELALETEPHPWDVWPPGEECLTPDRYFSYAASTGCNDLAKLIAAYKGDDYPLVRRLRAATAEAGFQIADENQRGGQGGVLLHRDTMKQTQGNTTSHLLRRLARDYPDFLAAYKRGEYPNPTSAARAAGIKVDTSPLVIARRAWRRMSDKEREIFVAEVLAYMEPIDGKKLS